MSEVQTESARRTRSGASRLQLILAAEKYFALRGFVGASLKDIQDAAGQRNASAVHYHFGSRDQLIMAILDHRIPPYAEKRRVRMAALEGREADLTIREVVAAWVKPLAEELIPREDGNYYIRFLDQLRRNGPVEARSRAAELQLLGYTPIFGILMEKMPGGSPRLNASRLALTAELILSGLARLETALPQGATHSDYPALAVANLIDYAAAGLSVAPDAETFEQERTSRSAIDFTFSFRSPL